MKNSSDETPSEQHLNPRHNICDVFPATGEKLTAKSWLNEAPMRMLVNNLHPDVAENPHELVVYGGIGRAARTREDPERSSPLWPIWKAMKCFWCSQESLWACSELIKMHPER